MFGAQTEIFGGTQAAEFTEVMVKVRLIGIAEVECQINPVDVCFLTDGPYYVLKTLHAAEKLWSHSYFAAKEFDESPLAEANFLGNCRTCEQGRVLSKCFYGKCHRRVMKEWPIRNPQEPSFQNLELEVDCPGFIQQTKQTVGAPLAPEVCQCDVGVMKVRVRESKQRKRATRFEMHSEKLIGSTPFDKERFGPWAGHSGLRRLRLVQLDDEFDGALRQYALPRLRLGMTDPVPENFHKIGQSVSGSAMGELNDSGYVRFCAHVLVRVQFPDSFSKGSSFTPLGKFIGKAGRARLPL